MRKKAGARRRRPGGLVTRARAGDATAEHITDGAERHRVKFGNLRVLVVQEDGQWFAQGIEVDYAAAGDSLEDVKDRFSRGLLETARAHIRRFETIDGMLRFAPEATWRRIFDESEAYDVTLQQVQAISAPKEPTLPFKQIAYLQRAHCA